jgi:hypothetical protein
VLPDRRLDQPPVATGAAWSWRNLFRPSDPIGGAIFSVYTISEADNGDVDWQLMDPAIGPLAGDRAWPRAYGHSDYFRDPAFEAACRLLEGGAGGGRAGAAPAANGEAPAAPTAQEG